MIDWEAERRNLLTEKERKKEDKAAKARKRRRRSQEGIGGICIDDFLNVVC